MGEDRDEDLLKRLRSGDEAAFVALYRRRQGALYRFALRMTGSGSTAEDVTQEVFLALLRKECGFDPSRGTLSGYLFGIARKLVLRHLDRMRALTDYANDTDQRPGIEPAAPGDPMGDLVHREGIERLRFAILKLPKRYREVVVLCDLEELDYAMAAAVLNCPVGTVRSRLHRARTLLLERLQKHENSPPVPILKPVRSEI